MSSVARMTIVDDLLMFPGLYVGIDTAERADLPGGARLVVTPLPAGAGVTLDYEIFNPSRPDRVRGHVEHTMLGRTHDGGTVMVIGHEHAPVLTILRETEPGTFELGTEASPFPMKVQVTMPEPEQLRHSWWYGAPGEEPVEQDVALLKRLR